MFFCSLCSHTLPRSARSLLGVIPLRHPLALPRRDCRLAHDAERLLDGCPHPRLQPPQITPTTATRRLCRRLSTAARSPGPPSEKLRQALHRRVSEALGGCIVISRLVTLPAASTFPSSLGRHTPPFSLFAAYTSPPHSHTACRRSGAVLCSCSPSSLSPFVHARRSPATRRCHAPIPASSAGSQTLRSSWQTKPPQTFPPQSPPTTHPSRLPPLLLLPQ